jgi:hypothetical protein
MDAAAGVTDLPKRTAADPSLRCGRVAVINSGTYPALQGAPLNIIRTETVLSTLPVHNLAKKGTIKIHIEQKNPQGEVKLLWEVSPSRDYGEPRQLAYKLDTTVINRRLDEAGRPLPGIIRLGSLRELARELGLGSDTATVRKALLQNASAFITAKLTYKGNDKRERQLETGFTRYSVAFTGERLPDGNKAEAVYLILNKPYHEVLNNAPIRPLDYDYLRRLRPAAQRFYEIVSRKIFAALKFKHPMASLRYSEYCTYSAQCRYFERHPVQNQMSAIHREHKEFGYIVDVQYQPTTDTENKADWIIHYTPGPRAKAEYQAFTRSGRVIETSSDTVGEEADLAPPIPARRASGPRLQHLRFDAPVAAPTADEAGDPTLTQMTRRGISARMAKTLLTGANPEFVLDQLEWGDHLIQSHAGQFKNPPGFYVHLIREKIQPPETFETSRRREQREAARAAESEAHQRQFELEEAYRTYRTAEVDRHIADHVKPADLEELIVMRVSQRRKDQWSKNLPLQTIREIAEREVRSAIAEQIPLLFFEEFTARQGGAGEAFA